MRGLRLVFAALLYLWTGVAGALAYDQAVVSQAELATEHLRGELQRIADVLQIPAITDTQLSVHRGTLEDVRAKALTQSTILDGPIAEVSQQLSGLGAAPAEGAQEAPAVAEQRKSLGATLQGLQGIKSQLDLVAVEAEQLSGRASSIQRQQFFQRIFQGGRSILNPLLWVDMGIGFGLLLGKLATLYGVWWRDVRAGADWRLLGLIPLFLGMLAGSFYLLRGRLRRWYLTSVVADRAPDEIEKLWRVARAGLLMPVLLGFLFVPSILVLDAAGLMTPRFELVFYASLEVIVLTLTYGIMARRIAAPGLPHWRIVDLDDRGASRFALLAGLLAFVSSLSTAAGKIADALFIPITYTVGQSALSAAVMLAMQALLHQPGLATHPPGRRLYFAWASRFVPFLWLAIAIGFGALLLGYVALADYIAQRIFGTAVLVGVLFLVHYLADAAVAASFDPLSGFGQALRRLSGLGERGIDRLGLLFRTVVDLLLVVAGLPLLFLQWTVTWVDFRSLLNTALFGFRVGDITVSPPTVLIVLGVLTAVIALTNVAVRWLDRRILVKTRIDKGIQDSVRKGASYAGYILAAGLALGAAGLDFSNLALVAGALGIGIGFGLQSIVNNFVSGLILLAERPVRVGDWVVLAAGEGLVKRINVRSTEIETFDSCSIIVPNSVLISEAVRNWTHGDNIGRIMVAVSVAYDSDAPAVHDLLVKLARAHPKVLTYPEPVVTLARFGTYSLDFEIKATVADIFEGVFIASDLRHAILAAFREKGIVIPVPVAITPER